MVSEITAKTLERLVSELRATEGDNLASIVLYGSTATMEFHSRADLNVLVVLRSAQVEDLKRCTRALRAWRNSRQPPPIIFTTEELKRAADVFPIEFLEMERARSILFGSDPFEGLEISAGNLRHQTEYELRTKFQQLRRLYLARAPAGKDLTNLMIDSFPSFAALFRALLILKGHEPPATKSATVRAVESLLDIDATPFDWILRDRDSAPAPDRVEAMFAAYLKEIERVIDAVDRLA